MVSAEILRLASLLFVSLYPWFHPTLIPPTFVDRVVAIGRHEPTGVPNQDRFVPEASGFLYGDFLSKQGELSAHQLYLVTNRHVIEGHIAATARPLAVKFNVKSAAPEYDAPLQDEHGKPLWHPHPNPAIDVAIMPINADFLKEQGARFDYFRSEQDLLTRAKAKEIGLSEGDGVFVLGFPMGIVDGETQEYVIVRQGVIARVRNTLESPVFTPFLIDSFVFPGNSGSPVVLRPEIVSIQGAKAPIPQAYLLGIVRDFVPYIDAAVSTQTKHLRVTFEENSGLVEVIPAEYIQETIDDLKKTTASHP